MAAEKENKDAIAADVKNLADNYYNKTQVEEKSLVKDGLCLSR